MRVSFFFLAILAFMTGSPTLAATSEGNPGTPWPALDGLGRTLPLSKEVGPPKPGRAVGIFYFLWHQEVARRSATEPGPLDISKIVAQDPDALKKPDSPLWGGIGASHYWGEPLYGYYRSVDPWVLRRHAQQLADAGIDMLIFDTTNAQSYPEVYRALCEVFLNVRREGGRTPQISFMVNTEADKTALKIYHDLYEPGLYKELWFRWQGKPLMICDPALASPELQQFFTLRRAHWPFTMTNTPVAWHWEATYPQPYGYIEDPASPEQVNVSVAQNLRQSDGKVTNMSSGEARGRSFHDGKEDLAPGATDYGYNFQEQWKRAFELQPPFVMVTGWNEWIAGRWGKLDGPLVFVDQFDREFSRDIEPMKGGHADNYYWQLVTNVRQFKGAPALPEASRPKTMRISKGFDQWQDVEPEYLDHTGETAPRDAAGVAGLHYRNDSGRNDIRAAKIARDSSHVFFYARTAAPLTPSGGSNWMWLLIDADRNPSTGWHGYDFMANRLAGSNGTAWLEKNDGGWNWTKVEKIAFRAEGNQLHLAISRKALNQGRGTQPMSLDFKWADNLQAPGEIMDFYLSGDVAPEGRFNYRYVTSQSGK